jgi:hypothetical protein
MGTRFFSPLFEGWPALLFDSPAPLGSVAGTPAPLPAPAWARSNFLMVPA